MVSRIIFHDAKIQMCSVGKNLEVAKKKVIFIKYFYFNLVKRHFMPASVGIFWVYTKPMLLVWSNIAFYQFWLLLNWGCDMMRSWGFSCTLGFWFGCPLLNNRLLHHWMHQWILIRYPSFWHTGAPKKFDENFKICLDFNFLNELTFYWNSWL